MAASPLLIDGGLATELEAAGHRLDDRLWSGRLLLDDPDAIGRVHRAYVEAGADVLITATYQLAEAPLRRRGLDDAAMKRIYARAVALADAARRGATRPTTIAASVGSFGASLEGGEEYRGGYLQPGPGGVTDAVLASFHEPRLAALLAEPRVDLIALETFPGAREVEVVVELIDRLVRRLGVRAPPVWASLSCRDDAHTGAGEPLEEVGRRLGDRVDGLGVNCSDPRDGSRQLDALARGRGVQARAGLLIYPNAGERYGDAAAGWCGERLAPQAFAAYASAWVDRGLLAVGGCCRTTPAHIAALRRRLDAS